MPSASLQVLPAGRASDTFALRGAALQSRGLSKGRVLCLQLQVELAGPEAQVTLSSADVTHQLKLRAKG